MAAATDRLTSTGTETDALSTVRAFFEAMAGRDLETVAGLFAQDATWNHRNQDRFEGIHHGREGILGFIGESIKLTNGTLRPLPEAFMPDGGERVAVLVRLSASRPDGRATDDLHMVMFTARDGQVTAVEHWVPDPAAVKAFWA
jgi:ketosteroid isomerase-like protein